MKNPLSEDDYFKESTMSFGEHLEELRKVLISSLYGLAIAMIFGMLSAQTVIKLFKRPIETALAKYRVEQKIEERSHLGTGNSLEFKNTLADNNLAPENLQFDTTELWKNLQAAYPEQFPQPLISPYLLTVDDFHVTQIGLFTDKSQPVKKWMTAAFLQRLVSESEKKGPAQTLWELLSSAEQETLKSLAKKSEDELLASEKQQLVNMLNPLLKKPELSQSKTWRGIDAAFNVSSVVQDLRLRLPPEEPNKEEDAKKEELPPLLPLEIERLNKLLLYSHFQTELRIPQQQLIKLTTYIPAEARVQSLDAQEPFMIWMKASFVSGFVIAGPWMFFQLWTFIAAGLYPHEKNYVYMYLPFSLGLFIAGALLAFIFVFEPVLDFLFFFNRYLEIDPDPRIGAWLNFVLIMPLAFGISFQLPLVMLFLNRIGVVDTKFYQEHWRIALLIIAVVAMIITPGGDPYSLLLMMIPLIALYFLGIGLCVWMPQGRNPFNEVYEP